MKLLRYAPAAFLFAVAASTRAETVVQVPMKGILNARPVTTWTGQKLVAWSDGFDGPYSGEATAAAAQQMGNGNVKAMPDNGLFPANADHPEVQLHFSNEDGTSPQAFQFKGAAEVTVPVPRGNYSALFVFFLSANGGSKVTVDLVYESAKETRSVDVPDWFYPITGGGSARFNLADDLAKWNNQNMMTEPTMHYLHGFDLAPKVDQTLTAVVVHKPGAGTLTFWGVTGVARSLNDGPVGMGGSPSTAGASNMGGGGGTGGANGGANMGGMAGTGTPFTGAGGAAGSVNPAAGSVGVMTGGMSGSTTQVSTAGSSVGNAPSATRSTEQADGAQCSIGATSSESWHALWACLPALAFAARRRKQS